MEFNKGKYRVSFDTRPTVTPVSPSADGLTLFRGGNSYGAFPHARHLETVNVLYTDGHVKTLKIAQFIDVNTITNSYTGFTVADD